MGMNKEDSKVESISKARSEKDPPLEGCNDWTFDIIFETIGEFGRYQKIICTMFSVTYIMVSMQLYGWVFVGVKVPHRCRTLEEIGSNPMFGSNFTSGCDYFNVERNVTIPCDHGYVYDDSEVFNSVVTEWDLVCDREALHSSVAASPMFGYLFGGIIFGITSDKFGRKPTFLFCNILMLLAGVGGSISPNFAFFIASRAFVGLFLAGVENSCFVIGMELVGPSMRKYAGILCWFFEAFGYLLIALTGYMLSNQSWRILQLVYSSPGILFFGYIWLAPESLRWLVSKGKVQESKKFLEKTARINNVNFEDGEIDKFLDSMIKHRNDDADSSYTIIDLFKHKNLAMKTVILQLTWIVCPALYYVLLLDQAELSDDKYLGFAATALTMLPGYFYVMLTLEIPAFGRKKSMSILLILSGVCMSIHPQLEASAGKILVSLVGRFSANCSYTILYMYTAELFPTVVRGIGVGVSLVTSRIGTILAPYTLLIGPTYPVIFGVGALAAGILALALPETRGTALPETIADGEKLGLSIPSFKRTYKIN